MKCSVKGCDYEGPESHFIMMSRHIEIAGKMTKVTMPICYSCNRKHLIQRPVSVGFKGPKS